MKGFIGGIPVILLAVAAHAMVFEHEDNDVWPRPGATVMGGPSGNDGDGGFTTPSLTSIETNSQVNEWNEDDHSVHLKHTKVDPRPVMVPVTFGSPGPRSSGPGPIKKRGVPGVTIMGGPSGDDGGENFNAPINVHTATGILEHNEDDHSIGLSHEDVYHPPPILAPAPVRRSEDQGRGSPANSPVKHFAPRPNNHFAPHPEPHFENSFENHAEPHYEPHPEPHFINHPEPHYDSHYSPSYEPHYEPHTSLENDFNMIKNTDTGPAAGAISFGRRPTN